jgi:hypothetical protein
VTLFAGRARWVLLAGSLPSIGWALVALLGWSGLVGLSGVVGVWLAAWRKDDVESRARRRRVAAAFRTQRRPLPGDAAEADRIARVQLAAPTADRWGPPAVMTALSVACVIVAVGRDDLLVALPAAPLLICAAVTLVVVRESDARADRWLAGRTEDGDGTVG